MRRMKLRDSRNSKLEMATTVSVHRFDEVLILKQVHLTLTSSKDTYPRRNSTDTAFRRGSSRSREVHQGEPSGVRMEEEPLGEPLEENGMVDNEKFNIEHLNL